MLATSVLHEDSAPETLDVVVVSETGAWAVTTPQLPIAPNGCGDVTAALFLAHLHETGSAERALALTTSAVYAVLEATIEAGTREIALIAAQEAIAARAERFDVRRLR